jgi:cation transport ATPase
MTSHDLLRPFLVAFPAIGILTGFILRIAGLEPWVDWAWAISTVPVLLALLIDILHRLHQEDFGLDLIAALSMIAALVFGEELAAAIVALMYAGGQYLESYAEGRAQREMTALLSRTPRTTMRHRDGKLEEIAIDMVAVGDCLLVRQGDVVPVDGRVVEGVAVLDQSALTGETIPSQRRFGETVMSGSANAGEAFRFLPERL